MNWQGLAFQALDGLASASGLFFVAAGLSLIFGVTRIINVAHGSLYMLGTYIAVTSATRFDGALGYWGGIVASAVAVGIIGALIERLLLRRLYSAPELFQLLATFALLLVINDATLWLWGPEDLLGPRAPGLRGAIEILGRRMPSYDVFLIAIAPLVLVVLHAVFTRTRFGRLVRAATEDREMLGALGVNQAVLFTAVFALGSLLAGLGGALQIAREPADLAMDLTVITDAFVVVVIGGMGSIVGSYIAAVLVAEVKALCIGVGLVSIAGISVNFSKFTLVAEFLVMAIVLIARPQGSAWASANHRAWRHRHRSADPPGFAHACGCEHSCAARLAVPAASCPLAAVRAGARRRCADRGSVRDQPAFHHGAGRHAFLRPCRLFRPRRLWRSPCREMACGADGHGARARAGRGRFWRVAVWLVCRALVRRLSRYAHARLCADRLVDRFPMAGFHRRLQRRSRHLAERAVRPAVDLLSAHAGLCRCRHTAAAAHFVCAVRLCDARRPRLAAARGSHRHQCQARALARLCHRRNCLRRCRRHLRFRQRFDLARDDQHRPLDRRACHGAAWRRSNIGGPGRRRFGLCRAAGLRHAADRILACAARRHHSCFGARFSRPNSSARSSSSQRGGGDRHERAYCRFFVQELSRHSRRRRCEFFGGQQRIPGADRSKRRRQIDVLQHHQRPACSRQRHDPLRRPQYRRRSRRAKSAAVASPAPFRSQRPSAR